MATPFEIVNEKFQQLELLWNSKKLRELVSNLYTSDAELFYFGNWHYIDHDQILDDFESSYVPNLHITLLEVIVVSEDYLNSIASYKTDGGRGYYQSIWKKEDNVWKMFREFCNGEKIGILS
jgi:hypothetical protein